MVIYTLIKLPMQSLWQGQNICLGYNGVFPINDTIAVVKQCKHLEHLCVCLSGANRDIVGQGVDVLSDCVRLGSVELDWAALKKPRGLLDAAFYNSCFRRM